MSKYTKEKQQKKRAEKYNEKLAINASFDQVIQASFLGKPPVLKQVK